MTRLGLVLAVVAALGWAGSASAQPSLVGPTGVIVVPSAETLGVLQWNVGATGILVEEGENESLLYANVGLTRDLEIGVARWKLQRRQAETTVNAKLRLLGPLPGEVSLAVGALDLTDQLERSGYVVLSHVVGAGILLRRGRVVSPQVHVGIGGGRFDGLFAGFSAVVDGEVEVMADWDGDQVNVGIRWPLASDLEASVAALNNLDDLAVGLSFSSPW